MVREGAEISSMEESGSLEEPEAGQEKEGGRNLLHRFLWPSGDVQKTRVDYKEPNEHFHLSQKSPQKLSRKQGTRRERFFQIITP